jgi:hypothetical protein
MSTDHPDHHQAAAPNLGEADFELRELLEVHNLALANAEARLDGEALSEMRKHLQGEFEAAKKRLEAARTAPKT